MAKVNFYLRNKKAKNNTMINLVFHYENKKIKIPTGLSINPKYWNNKSQRARELLEFPAYSKINSKLEGFRSFILIKYEELEKDYENFDKNTLKKVFLTSQGPKRSDVKQNTFWSNFEEFIAYKKRELPSIGDYDKSLRKHLIRAEELFGKPITFAMLKVKNDGFIDRMDEYLTYEALNKNGKPGLSTNTIGKQFKNLKVFLNWYFDKEPESKFSLKHLVVKSEEVDNIFLTESELEKLEAYELEKDVDLLVRDLFLLGCETGLRFSDFTRINKDHIRNGNLHIRPKKTEDGLLNNKVVIPISTRAKKVIARLFSESPTIPYISITDFNKTIRNICKNAGIDDDIMIIKKITGKTIEQVYKKYELASSHTCRRTFCTLKFLAGMPAQAIMKFSGHKTERAFLKYLKLDAELAAIKYVDYFK